jgi:hypothetical protein
MPQQQERGEGGHPQARWKGAFRAEVECCDPTLAQERTRKDGARNIDLVGFLKRSGVPKAENPAKIGKNRRKYHKNHKKIGKTLLFALTLPMQMSQGNERRVLRPA